MSEVSAVQTTMMGGARYALVTKSGFKRHLPKPVGDRAFCGPKLHLAANQGVAWRRALCSRCRYRQEQIERVQGALP